MISAEQLTAKVAAKKAAITKGVVGLQNTINGYNFDPNATVKLADHKALGSIITQATQALTLINELGVLKNVGKRGGAAAPRRARRF